MEQRFLNLEEAFSLNKYEVLRLYKIMQEKGWKEQQWAIVVINNEDDHHRSLVKLLSEVITDEQFHDSFPFFVRGLISRARIQEKLNIMDPAAADELLEKTGFPVVVMNGNIKIFSLA